MRDLLGRVAKKRCLRLTNRTAASSLSLMVRAAMVVVSLDLSAIDKTELTQQAPRLEAGVSDPALSLVNSLVSADRASFFVYKNSDSGSNHAFPSGWFPGGPVLSKIHLDTACVYDPVS